MRCDKCGKIFDNNWTPDTLWPKYDITEHKGVMYRINKIYLCDRCSQKFSEWLEEKENGENEKDI